MKLDYDEIDNLQKELLNPRAIFYPIKNPKDIKQLLNSFDWRRSIKGSPYWKKIYLKYKNPKIDE